MTDNSLQARMNENKHIIRQIVRAIIFLAKQGLPFRGDVECSLQSNKKNPGNFLALLKNYAAADEALFNDINIPPRQKMQPMFHLQHKMTLLISLAMM